ncbi:MAG TPA: AAA family ATPase [Acidimicrobiia bacterium]
MDASAAPLTVPASLLVGRDHELTALRSAFDDACAGHGRFVLVTGDAGMGKTSLLDAFATEVRDSGARVLRGTCWSTDDAPPLMPWSQVVREWLRDADAGRGRAAPPVDLADLRRLLPEVHEADDPDADRTAAASDVPLELSESTRERWLLFEAVAGLVGAAAEVAPTVIVLDDIHDADLASMQLLRFVAPQTVTRRVLVAVAARADELPRTHAELLAGLASSTVRLDLRGLGRTAMGELVQTLTGATATDAVVQRVQDHTGGNPFFTREVLRLLVAEGRLDAAATLPLPDSVQAVLRRRLEGLSAACVEMLSVAAVAGDQSSVELLATVTGLDHAHVVGAIDEAAAARLVVGSPARPLVFTHALVRATVTGALTAALRRELHLVVGRALERSRTSPAVPVAHLAHHFVAALPDGDPAVAAAYATEAGDRAAALYAYDDATRHYNDALLALDLERGCPSGQRLSLLLALGDARSRAGDRAAAAEAYWQAIDLAGAADDGSALARAALGLGGRMEEGRADSALIGVLEDALVSVPASERELRARVMARLAHALLFTSAVDRRRALATEAVDLARRSASRGALASALYVWHIVDWTPTNVSQRLEACHELCALGDDPYEPELAMLGHHLLAYDHAERGDIAPLERELAVGVQLADELHQPLWQWIAHLRVGMRSVMRGRFDEGERILGEAFAMGSEVEPELALLLYGSALLPLRLWQGRLGELEPALRAHADVHPEAAAVRCALALACVEKGDLEDARAELRLLVGEDVESLPNHSSWVISVAALSRVAAAIGDAHHARGLYELLLPLAGGAIVGPFAEACFGSVDHYLALDAATLSDDAKAREHFSTAMTRNHEMDARPALAETQLHFAEFLADRGDGNEAAGLLAEARRTFDALGMETYAGRADELAPHVHVGGRPSAPAGVNVFRLEGTVWRVSFHEHTALVDDRKGLRDLAYLLHHPRREVHVLDLVGSDRANPGDRTRLETEPVLVRGDELLDAQARRAYEARIVELDVDLSEAELAGDGELAARARAERDLLTDELARALGLGGRARQTPDAGERARQAVRARIRDAVRTLRRVHPSLAAHLEHSVRTGYFCCYEPEEPVTWQR